MIHITGIPAFSDNYLWCLHDQKNAIVVDPGCAKSVDNFLVEHNLNLVAILITHHHPDHIGGVKQLKEKYSPLIYGYAGANFEFLDYKLHQDDVFTILDLEFKVLEVPGHTLDHIAFYTESIQENDAINTKLQPRLFCGDTLFSAGCGRLFEGTPEQMLHSLKTIKSLPLNTLIYCAHEYTLSNLAFAKTLMPLNNSLREYTAQCIAKRHRNEPTIPTLLSIELAINPFLRESDPEIYESLRVQNLVKQNTDLEVFRATRKAKDNF